jgi:hypothetical protein
MHHLSYSESRYLTNTPASFGAPWRHLQGVLPQLLTFQHVKWLQAVVRPCAVDLATVKRQRDLVNERWCIKCWLNYDKISTSIMQGMYILR